MWENKQKESRGEEQQEFLLLERFNEQHQGQQLLQLLLLFLFFIAITTTTTTNITGIKVIRRMLWKCARGYITYLDRLVLCL